MGRPEPYTTANRFCLPPPRKICPFVSPILDVENSIQLPIFWGGAPKQNRENPRTFQWSCPTKSEILILAPPPKRLAHFSTRHCILKIAFQPPIIKIFWGGPLKHPPQETPDLSMVMPHQIRKPHFGPSPTRFAHSFSCILQFSGEVPPKD